MIEDFPEFLRLTDYQRPKEDGAAKTVPTPPLPHISTEGEGQPESRNSSRLPDVRRCMAV